MGAVLDGALVDVACFTLLLRFHRQRLHLCLQRLLLRLRAFDRQLLMLTLDIFQLRRCYRTGQQNGTSRGQPLRQPRPLFAGLRRST